MDQLIVPDGALVVLIGAAGAGKTTLAARHFPSETILSSDGFRARLGGSEADQSVTRPAFAALHRALLARLARGRLTVVDATNVTAAARASLLRLARSSGAPPIALVLDVPAEVAIARNAARDGRVVPEAAVRRQLGALERADDATLRREGFATVLRLRTPSDIATLQVLLPADRS